MIVTMLVDAARELLFLLLLLSAPLWGAALFTGALVGLLTQYTKMSEPAVGFVARAIAVLGTCIVAAPWIGHQITEFAAKTWLLLEQVVL